MYSIFVCINSLTLALLHKHPGMIQMVTVHMCTVIIKSLTYLNNDPALACSDSLRRWIKQSSHVLQARVYYYVNI